MGMRWVGGVSTYPMLATIPIAPLTQLDMTDISDYATGNTLYVPATLYYYKPHACPSLSYTKNVAVHTCRT